jgi:polyisoprenoid-binding protein YceI
MKRTIHPALVLIALAAAGVQTSPPANVGSAWPVAADQPQSIASHAAPTTWRIDPARSEARFTVTKLGFQDVTGVFRESDGEIRYDPARLGSSSIHWRVRVASVLTDASNRDRALQGKEYFDAATHPYLSFVSRSVRAGEAGTIEVAGEITMRGVTRPLTLSVRPRATPVAPAFETDFEIDRYDFGIVGGSVLGRLIGAKVRIHVLAATAPQ